MDKIIYIRSSVYVHTSLEFVDMNIKLFTLVISALCVTCCLGILIPASDAINDIHNTRSILSESGHLSKPNAIAMHKNRSVTTINPGTGSKIPIILPGPISTPVFSSPEQINSNFFQNLSRKKPPQMPSIVSEIKSEPIQPWKPHASTISENGKAMVEANNQFAIDYYTHMVNEQGYADENIFFSPWSISSALAITYEGARGTTAEEIRSVFHFPVADDTRREGYSELISVLNTKRTGYTLYTANALWAEKTYPFLSEYISTADQYYDAETTNLDFINMPEESRQIINSWVEEKTNNRIKDLIPPGAIHRLTRLVITNAIYFKGTWVNQFAGEKTVDADFLTGSGTTVTVPMMVQTDADALYGYAETDTLQVLRMPYVHKNGDALSMLVLLPKGNTLEALETSLTAEKIADLNQALTDKRVFVYFPRFRLDTGYQLSGALSDMGMPGAFILGDADFSGMDGSRDLFIDDVFHKAFVEVNEEGTEAAAATAVTIAMGAEILLEPIPVFRADHPFLFLIQDDDTGNILFMGRMVNPAG